MAYMDEMALEREKSKQALLAGKQPLLGDDSVKAMHALGVNLGLVPPGTPPSAMTQLLESFVGHSGAKGIHVDNPTPLQVSPVALNRTPSTEVNRYSDGSGDLGGVLKGILDAAKGGGLKQMRDKLQQAQAPVAATGNTNLRNMATRGNTPEARSAKTRELIPGLKPGTDASQQMPGMPSATAYQTEQTPGPGVTAAERGGAGYKADLQFLQERGGHTTQIIDGKKTNTPMDAKGSYGAVDPELAARLRTAGEAYEKETGKKAQYGEFSRGADVQQLYWDESAHGTKYAAAPPGRSHHQQGTAGDLPSGEFRDWLNAGNKDKYGLHFPVKNDAPHVEANPAFKDKLATPAGPELPAWDRSNPPAAQDPKTQWPAATDATPADKIAARPVDTTTGAPAGGQGVTPQLMESIKQIESSGNPNAVKGQYKGLYQLSDAQFAKYGGQGSIFDPAENTRVAKLVIADEAKNLSSALGRPVTASEIYMAHQQGAAGAAAHLSNPNQPAWKSMASTAEGQQKGEAWAKQAIWGNVPDDLKARYGSVDNMTSKQFTDMWKERGAQHGLTDAPAAAAAPADPKAGTVDVAGSAPAAAPAASAFDKGAPAVPVAGVGALQQPDTEAGTTATHTVDPATAALNAIQPPAVARPPVVAAATAASAPPQPAAAAVTPPAPAPAAAVAPPPPPVRPAGTPPPPPAAAARPAAPPMSGVDKAHGLLDMKAIDFVKKYAPGEIGRIPQSYHNTPMRDAAKIPLVGGQVLDGVKQVAGQQGVKPAEVDQAFKAGAPAPGKRSDAGPAQTSDQLLAQAEPKSEPGAAPSPTQLAQADTGTVTDTGPGGAQRFMGVRDNPAYAGGPYGTGPATPNESFHPHYNADKNLWEPASAQPQWADFRQSDNILDERGRPIEPIGAAQSIQSAADLVYPPDFRKNDPAPTSLGRDAGMADLLRQADLQEKAKIWEAQPPTPPPPGLDKVPLPQPGPRTENRNAAQVEMNLTPQERALYDRHIDNLNGPGGVDNPDGSRSSLYQTVEEHDGKFYNVPTVWDGKIQTEKWTDPKSGKTFDIPNKTALDNINKTGWDKFPAYATPEQADARYEQMHGYMDKDTGTYLAGRGQPQAPQQPQVTPEMAKALENALKDESKGPQAPPPPPEALPVQPINNLPQGVPGGPQGGLSLAPGGLSTLPSNAYMPAVAGSQGGSIATAGLMPLPAIENSTYSTPLINNMATNNTSFGSSSLSPIPWQTLGSWGWGGSGGSSFGGGGGFDFGSGAGGGMVMPEMSFGGG